VFALAGSGVNFNPALRLTLAGVLFVVSSLIGVWLYRRHRHGAALESDLDEALGESGDTPARP
jgi:membrane protein implicated in regulation of membrane protease activity